MEDFRRAYEERLLDEARLEAADRRLAAMHLGGVAIECLLKAMRVEIYDIKEWHIPRETCPGCRAEIRRGKPQPHGIENPGHDLMRAVSKWPRLWQRLNRSGSPHRAELVQWIQVLEQPSCHYIDLRYKHNIPSEAKFSVWREAFQRVQSWLVSQDQGLRRRH